MKKPFSIRLEETDITRFNAIRAVKNEQGEELIKEMLLSFEENMSEAEYTAYEALMNAWK